MDKRWLSALSLSYRMLPLIDERVLSCFMFDRLAFGRGPVMLGFCHWRFKTDFNAARSSPATTSSTVGEAGGISVPCNFRMGLVTRTELPAEFMLLSDDSRVTQSPRRTNSSLVKASGVMAGSGGTGPDGGLLVGAPNDADLACIDGRSLRFGLRMSRSAFPKTAPSVSRTPADTDLRVFAGLLFLLSSSLAPYLAGELMATDGQISYFGLPR